MSSLAQYLKHFNHSGAELVLETAARDSAVSDDEYTELWKAIHGGAKAGRRGGKSHALKMFDRDFARTSNG
jgi:hypothetical protein